MEPDTWVSTPCHVHFSVSQTISLGIIQRVNTDYHHGDCPAGSFGCGVQMKTGDHVHPVVGRIRAWDALIILSRGRVSSRLFIFHLSFSPTSIIFLSRRLNAWTP